MNGIQVQAEQYHERGDSPTQQVQNQQLLSGSMMNVAASIINFNLRHATGCSLLISTDLSQITNPSNPAQNFYPLLYIAHYVLKSSANQQIVMTLVCFTCYDQKFT